MTFGLPYMGSKQAIVDSICMNFPKSEHFYDLFGGGGSVTHYMMLHRAKNHSHFHYNELNPLVSDLFKRATVGEFSYDMFKPEWISKEDFFARKERDGYVKYVWSFGNNGRFYLFGEDIEPYKKSMHMALVFGEFDALAFIVFGFKEWPKDVNTIKKRRFYLRQKMEWFNKNKRIPKELYRFLSDKQLKQMGVKDNVKQLEQLQALQQLQALERLQQFERLEQLERLTITNCSYEQVEIKPNSVVYCDIPYAGTACYGLKNNTKEENARCSFNHKAFFDWAASRDFPVYISEYNVPDKRFQLVYSIDKKPLLAQGGTELVKNKAEKLYWNGKSL
jgi:site-specific DNA-adenine methylase